MEAVWITQVLESSSRCLLGCEAVCPKDGGIKVLRNVHILPQHYTVSQLRRLWFESSTPWRPQVLPAFWFP